MDKSYYQDRLHQRLPKVLQSGQNLSSLFAILGQEMVTMAASANILLRSRWYGLARGWDPDALPEAKVTTELGRIGDLFGLLPGKHESSKKYRERLTNFIHLHRDGLGNAQAILRLVALVYRAEKMSKPVYEEGCTCTELTVKNKYNELITLPIKIEDNPIKPMFHEFQDVHAGDQLLIENKSFEPQVPVIQLTATNSEISVPLFIHKETGINILYVGGIPQGIHLELQEHKPPLLNGFLRQELPLNYTKFDQAKFYQPSDTFKARYCGVGLGMEDLLLVGQGFKYADEDEGTGRFFSHALAINSKFLEFKREGKFPVLSPGKNTWIYRTVPYTELRSYLLDHPQRDDLLLHAAQKENQDPVNIRISWHERIPACFSLHIPGSYIPPFMNDFIELEQALIRAATYGKAAGINAKININMAFDEKVNLQDTTPSHTINRVLKDRQDSGEKGLTKQTDFLWEKDTGPTEQSVFTSHQSFTDHQETDDNYFNEVQTRFELQQNLKENLQSHPGKLEFIENLTINDRFALTGIYNNARFDQAVFTKKKKRKSRKSRRTK